MAVLRAHAEHEDPGEPVTEDVDFFIFQRMKHGLRNG